LRRLVAIVALAGLAAGGCGADSDDPIEIVKQYVEAFDRGEDDRACGELVTERFLAEVGADACRRQVAALSPLDVKVDLIASIDERGDSAVAVVRLEINGKLQRRRIRLRRQDGEWRIDQVRVLG
jgi:hypothetical protein